ncbi:hypothetical protein ACGRHY_26100 [Streptomyces sp. HK10]|uniref:hypothetical protein n=1 Tax=Streptomyces sp. HK10 TaxID=3373255 RepID=UPI0037484FFF
MTTRPMLTQQKATAACNVSRTTTRREAGELPGTVQNPQATEPVPTWPPGRSVGMTDR